MNIFNIILKGQIIKAKLGTKERYCHIDVILEMWADGIRIEKKINVCKINIQNDNLEMI